jgi:hypothetical protein
VTKATLMSSGYVASEHHGKAALVADLKRGLEEQWWSNHIEHCGRTWPHPPSADCHWPRPAVLDELPRRLRDLGLEQRVYALDLGDDVWKED